MKIAILGHFGIGLNLLNGQTVKTQNLQKGFEKYTDVEIVKIDSHGWIKKPFKLFKNIKKAFLECDAVIMLPAHNGVKVFSPILLHFKKKYGKKLFYDVIGGWLPDFLSDKKRLANVLCRFDGVWVETEAMKLKLEQKYGFNNLTVIPNFKDLSPLSEGELIYSHCEPFRLCTFSRVMKEKGIGTAVEAVKSANTQLGRTVYSLDIYGQVDENQTEWFKNLQSTFPDYIRYCGCVDASKSVEVLKDCFSLLFPTYYDGEGFAGTLIDAYSAGVPVIATDWKYNGEFVNNNIGFIYKWDVPNELTELLCKIAEQPDIISDKKVNCIAEAEKYTAKNVLKTILNELDKR